MIIADKRKAVFLLHQEGVSKRAIARQLRLSRNAVRRVMELDFDVIDMATPVLDVSETGSVRLLDWNDASISPRARRRKIGIHGPGSESSRPWRRWLAQ